MSPIRCLPATLLGILGLTCISAQAQPGLGEAVRAADAKYLEAPEIGIADDDSPTIVAGGGEEGVTPEAQEISFGPLRVTLTYREVEPDDIADVPETDRLDGGTADLPPEAIGEEDQALAAEIPPLEEIPEEAMLPDEVGLGSQVWHAPVVTVYFTGDEAEGAAPSEGDASPEAASEAGSGEMAGGESADAPSAGRIVAKLEGDSAGFFDPPVSVQIAELDPGNPYPEVVVSFFTGGAHCCSVTSVVTAAADGSAWQTVDVGEFDGGPMLAVDLDGDGTYEFETRDNAFLYAFGCYACSEAPLQVLSLRDGSIEDVSAAPRFRAAHAAWLKNMIVGVPEEEVNGFLAGYVGQKIRLGEGKQAWDLMLKYYDRQSDWGLEVCDREPDETGECPGQTVKLTFPEALERMLNENGYKISG